MVGVLAMEYKVTLDSKINFAPGSEVEEILQNVRTILSTRIGTVPLDRDFGIDWSFIDSPLPAAKALFQAAVIDAILDYEPRANVVSVELEEDYNSAMDGVLKPVVTVSIGDEEE